MFKKYKILFISLFIILFIGLVLGIYFLFKKDIYFGNFESETDIVDVNSSYEYLPITACYGNRFKCSSISVDVTSDVDTSVLGTYSVTYRANYKGHSKSVVRNVSVVDNESPIIEVASDSLSVCPNATEYDISYKAYDNYDGDLSSSVSREVVDDTLVFTVTDSSNNMASKNVLLVREDTEAPSISLKGNSTLYVALNSSYSEPGYNAYDNCSGDLSSRVSVSGSVDTSTAGSYTLKYSVSDDYGNSSSISRSVKVYTPNSGGSGVIYLTFDDGPSQYTGELLNILSKYNVKATFFVTNINSNYSYYIKQAYEQGHSIALHTSSHNYSQIYASTDAYFADLNLINETVKNMTGSYSTLLRFPGGSSNTVSRKYSSGIMSSLSRMVEERGFKYFDWNVSSGDADGRSHSSQDYANNIISQLGSGSYYIVLQHDTNINSIRSVGSVIEYGLAHGYSFQTLDMSSPTVHHKIAN